MAVSANITRLAICADWVGNRPSSIYNYTRSDGNKKASLKKINKKFTSASRQMSYPWQSKKVRRIHFAQTAHCSRRPIRISRAVRYLFSDFRKSGCETSLYSNSRSYSLASYSFLLNENAARVIIISEMAATIMRSIINGNSRTARREPAAKQDDV